MLQTSIPGNSDALEALAWLALQIQFYVSVLFISILGFMTLSTFLSFDNFYPFWVI